MFLTGDERGSTRVHTSVFSTADIWGAYTPSGCTGTPWRWRGDGEGQGGREEDEVEREEEEKEEDANCANGGPQSRERSKERVIIVHPLFLSFPLSFKLSSFVHRHCRATN